MLVAPAEPKQFLELSGDNQFSVEPEKYGCDFLMYPQGKACGVQRKECSDLIASVRADDRMSTGMSKMTALDRAAILFEGKWGWDKDGRSTKVKGAGRDGFLRSQFDGICMAAQANGVFVLFSDSIEDSIRVLRQYESFLSRESHHSLFTRPKSRIEEWGTARSRPWAIRFYQSWDGVSVVTAGAIYDAIGIPLQWDDDIEARLKAIPGVGPKRIQSLMGAFSNGVSGSASSHDVPRVAL